MKKHNGIIVFALVVAFALSVAAPAFAGGVEGWPVEGKPYKMVTNKVAYPGIHRSWLHSYGRWYGMESGWSNWETGEYTSYLNIAYRDKRFKHPMVWGFEAADVTTIRSKRAKAIPTVKFYYTEGKNWPGITAVVTARPKAKLWAPEPFFGSYSY